jgi:hypothetical protein
MSSGGTFGRLNDERVRRAAMVRSTVMMCSVVEPDLYIEGTLAWLIDGDPGSRFGSSETGGQRLIWRDEWIGEQHGVRVD